MTSIPTTEAPGGFVPRVAISFGPASAPAVAVDHDSPLPTQPGFGPSTAVPIVGTIDADGVIGPFVLQLGRAIWVPPSSCWWKAGAWYQCPKSSDRILHLLCRQSIGNDDPFPDTGVIAQL